MIINTSLAALAAGEKVTLGPGDTLRLEVSFKYTVAAPTVVTLWASLGLGIGRDIENFLDISLEASTLPKAWRGTIDIPIPTSGKTNGTYWLRAEIGGYPGTQTTIDNAVEITNMPGGILDYLPMLIMVMVMSSIMGVMQGGEEY